MVIDEKQKIGEGKEEEKHTEHNYLLPASIILSALIIVLAWVYKAGFKTRVSSEQAITSVQKGRAFGAPISGGSVQKAELPAVWGNLGARMVESGIIDRARFEALYAGRGGLTEEEKQFLREGNGKLAVTRENSGFVLNLLWALGLGNKNKILKEGPMTDVRYGGAERFASTGGWTLAKDDPAADSRQVTMSHYAAHSFIMLTPAEQAMVERVSRNIHRPCCDNSAYFPDCNHGMAMLGLLELMASQGVSEREMYKTALQVNAFWFPEQYATIARYLESRGLVPQLVDPKEILSKEYSSASGYRRIASLVPRVEERSGGGCSA